MWLLERRHGWEAEPHACRPHKQIKALALIIDSQDVEAIGASWRCLWFCLVEPHPRHPYAATLLLTVYFGTPSMFVTLWFGFDYGTNPPLGTLII
jgi:hypothetical protein